MANKDIPVPKCREMVDGGLMSWPCGLPQGHIGPHTAIEVPASARRRDLWLEENASTEAAAAPASAPVEEELPTKIAYDPQGRRVVSSVPLLKAYSVASESDRLAAIRREVALNDDWSRTPFGTTILMSMLAQESLSILLEQSMQKFDAGATTVRIDRDFIDALIPPSLRWFLKKS